MLSAVSIPYVVLFTANSASTHWLRQSLRRAGLTANLEAFDHPEDLMQRLRFRDFAKEADFVLLAEEAIARMGAAERQDFLRQLREASPSSPVILVERPRILEGSSDEEGSGASNAGIRPAELQGVSRCDVRRLPEYLERAFRSQRDQKARARVQGELDRTAEILRENQKLIALGRLTASIVHEINNPLEAVTNLLYLLEADPSPERRHEYLQLAQRELGRVVQISRQTLNFSRESASPVQISPADLIEEVLTLFGRKIADKQISVEREFEAADTVNVFPGEMRQVLSNLIANAIEATAPGGRLRLRVRPARNWADQGVRGLRISVADTGAGMPAAVRSRIGEPFFTTKGSQGTGLGLWVTRSILHRYGGGLQLRSSVSKAHHGTVFSLFLPTNMRPQAVLAFRSAATPPATPQSALPEAGDIDHSTPRASNHY
ncbi:sensor histidine kinase [Silvibacterium sp.]|uniref:sensor histidine kinase n=1 Tax=Silvibacterium sp. TaxID=1964179 RepID=UPI0039E3ACDA